MGYSYDRRASQGIVVRDGGRLRSPVFAPTCDDFYGLKRSGHFYRGMENAEWKYIQAHGHIKSMHKWCVPGEGTCFTDSIADAEGYVDNGSTDPRITGQSNYIIEVRSDILKEDRRDGYWKTLGDDIEVPKSAITRAWRLQAEEDKILAYPDHV